MSGHGVTTAFDVIASTPATLRGLLEALPDDVTSWPADEGWSPRDVVAHLASLDPLTLVGRVRAIVEQDNPVLPDINDEHAVLEGSGLRGRPLGSVLDQMARQRAEALVWLRALTPQQLARTGRHSTVGPLTAAEIIHHKAWHDLLHVQQICRMLAIPLDAGSGAMRQFH
jgi:hypothetical protein